MKTARAANYFVITLLLTLYCSALATAQDGKQDAQLRTVRGVVLDKDEKPVATAIVYLKNTRNSDVRTLFSDSDGNYRFSGLDPNIDYEVHAEKDVLASVTRTVSSFDSRKDMVINLKLDKKKR